MTDEDLNRSLARLYRLMVLFAGIGFIWCFHLEGLLPAIGFLLGVVGSFGNLWLFSWLSRAMGPGEGNRKPWQAGTFISRYFLLFAAGYVIVKGLGVSPLPVVFGLFASTAAILISATFEIIQGLFTRGGTR